MHTSRYALSPTGRWGGRATSRPLPEAHDEIRALAPDERRALANLWLSQAATERRVGYSFDVVHRALVALDADAGLIETAARAVDDELRHAELCCEMASRYAERRLDAPEELPFSHPMHPEARTEALRRALWVLGQCSLNETFAAAYLECSHENATVPLARAALRELLSDEIDHARVGWAFASTLDEATRAELSDWLVPLAICNLREWRSLTLPTFERDAVYAHGVPRRAQVEAALRNALDEMIAPGFERFGFDVRPLRAWIARGAATSGPADPLSGYVSHPSPAGRAGG